MVEGKLWVLSLGIESCLRSLPLSVMSVEGSL